MKAASTEKKVSYLNSYGKTELYSHIFDMVLENGLLETLGAEGIDDLTDRVIAERISSHKRKIENRKIFRGSK